MLVPAGRPARGEASPAPFAAALGPRAADRRRGARRVPPSGRAAAPALQRRWPLRGVATAAWEWEAQEGEETQNGEVLGFQSQ